MICTRCDGTGVLNAHLMPGEMSAEEIREHLQSAPDDVTVCDCCGDGAHGWYGEPGSHHEGGDDPGPLGPYAYNGGLPECH